MNAVQRVPVGRAGQAPCLFLLGPLRLADAAGRDLTPGSGLQCAMLAVLALAPRGTVARARLQDMFWGEKEPHLAAQSLRTALHGLRRSLAHIEEGLLQTDEAAVSLRLDRLQVDLLDWGQAGWGQGGVRPATVTVVPDVLEGVNPRIDGGAEGFEDWLRDTRSYWQDRLTAEPVTAVAMPAPRDLIPEADPPILGLLMPVVQGGDARTRFLADALLDALALSLRDQLGARIYDYRELAGETGLAGGVAEPALYLRLRLYQQGDWTQVRVVALGDGCREMIWSREYRPDAARDAPIEEGAAEFLSAVVAMTADSLAQPGASAATISPFHAMNVMFQLDHDALDDLRGSLDESWQRTADPIYLALQSYLNTFRVGEHWGAFDADLGEETRAILADDRLTRSTNGLAQALSGHAAGYILHDRDTAEDRLTRALQLAPQSAFAWDHLALHRMYAARYDDAREAAGHALRLGTGSPIAFTFDTTHCMIATLEGRFDLAQAAGRRVLARRPNYGAALRYTAVSLAHLGAVAEATQLVTRIRGMDAGFSADWVDQNRMAIDHPGARQVLHQGLRRAGA